MSFNSFAFASSEQASEVSYVTAEFQENSAETNDNEISWSTLDYSLAITGGVIGSVIGGGATFFTTRYLSMKAHEKRILIRDTTPSDAAIVSALGLTAGGMYLGAKYGKDAGLWLSNKISSKPLKANNSI